VVAAYGPWVYALLFLIIFVETGLVVMPFLPGDSLLFVAGAIAGVGGMNLPLLLALLTIARSRATRSLFGGPVLRAEGLRLGAVALLQQAAFDRTHAFYERYGAITIIVARFLPFVRTFAPFVAGIAQMTYPKFALYNVVGGVLWVFSLTTLGWWIGNTAWVKQHFQWVTLAFIVIPACPRCSRCRATGCARAAAAEPAAGSAAIRGVARSYHGDGGCGEGAGDACAGGGRRPVVLDVATTGLRDAGFAVDAVDCAESARPRCTASTSTCCCSTSGCPAWTDWSSCARSGGAATTRRGCRCWCSPPATGWTTGRGARAGRGRLPGQAVRIARTGRALPLADPAHGLGGVLGDPLRRPGTGPVPRAPS